MANKMRAIHPGEVLAGELDELGLSVTDFSERISIPEKTITLITKQRKSVTPNIASSLAEFFGTSPEFWINLQSDYDLKSKTSVQDNFPLIRMKLRL